MLMVRARPALCIAAGAAAGYLATDERSTAAAEGSSGAVKDRIEFLESRLEGLERKLQVGRFTRKDKDTAHYSCINMEGWKVYLSEDLQRADRAQDYRVGLAAKKQLECELYTVSRLVGQEPLQRMRQVPIWLELHSDAYCACYHWGPQWLLDHGYNPDKGRSVEITNAKHFLEYSLSLPHCLLHELAHG
jgi:hypothetical protein